VTDGGARHDTGVGGAGNRAEDLKADGVAFIAPSPQLVMVPLTREKSPPGARLVDGSERFVAVQGMPAVWQPGSFLVATVDRLLPMVTAPCAAAAVAASAMIVNAEARSPFLRIRVILVPS
jgi:hypothetical protein